MEQSFYLGHTDDILCLGHHAASDLIATGQVGKDPPIHVWNMKSKETVSVLKGKHLLD
jgi:microtubule-associated protein-like 6